MSVALGKGTSDQERAVTLPRGRLCGRLGGVVPYHHLYNLLVVKVAKKPKARLYGAHHKARPSSSMDRAPVFGTGCWGFESLLGHQILPH
jgi:hypothetical protein